MTAAAGRRRWKPGALARNTALATAWQGVRLALQFAYLILVARVLGVEGYGVFAGSVALAASLSPLVGWGFGVILVQEVSRAPGRFPEFWAKALRAVAVTGPALAGAMLALAPLMLPVDGRWTVIVLIAAAELLAMPFVVAGSLAFQAHERLGRTIYNHVQLNLVRLGAVTLLAATGQGGLVAFAWAYFSATAVAALLSLAQVGRAFGHPDWTRSSLAGRLREGFGFSLSLVATTAQSEIDKTLSLRLATATAAGNYSVASRIVSAATTPLIAYILATVPRLFREAGQGTAISLALRLLPAILIYGIAAGAGLLVLAPFLPLVFGEIFVGAMPLIDWLAPLPLFTGIALLGLNVLSASGLQRTRIQIEIFALIINVVLNMALIHLIGISGSAIATLISQLILAAVSVAIIFNIKNHVN